MKTTIVLPADLWADVKTLAIVERKDFRSVVIEALTRHVTPVQAALRHKLRRAEKGGAR